MTERKGTAGQAGFLFILRRLQYPFAFDGLAFLNLRAFEG